jgi:hypothetical protein
MLYSYFCYGYDHPHQIHMLNLSGQWYKRKLKYINSALNPSYVQPIITSSFAYKINKTVLYHIPAIADVRILELNFAEKDHNWKSSITSSSQLIDTGVYNM